MRPQSRSICHDCLRLLRKASLSSKHIDFQRHASTSGRQEPLRLGIIGSGPAGFYAAARVMQKLPDARVDMYEKLPVPFGLVRYGVAPDHPEVKNCQDRFEEVASSDRFQFMGNITVGRDVRLAQMKNHYDALLFAYGAAKDRLLGIPGERELKGIYSAREFVGWYNGLPEFARLSPNLDTDHAVVIGNGNVALDVARILLTDVDSLRKTDISDYALDALSKSRVNRVTIAGRRGPMQAAFTIKELRELVDLPGTAFRSDNIELIPSAEWIAKLPRLEQRRYRFAKLLTAGASAADRHCHLRSLLSPQAFIDDRKDGVLSQVTFRYNKFKDDTQRFNSTAQVEPTERLETLDAGLAFRSIGYKAVSIPGLREELGVDFSERSGTILNDGFGRALQRRGDVNGSPVQALPGCYCTGWVKNGPTGVIATTMGDAFSSADSVVEDWASGLPFLNGSSCGRNPSLARGWSGLQAQVGLSNLPTHVSWSEWRAIDELEKQLGREQGGKPRAKLRDVEQMMTAAHHSHADQSTQR